MATRILAVSTVLLAALLLHQYSTTSDLRAQVAAARTQAVAEARASVIESLAGRGPELQRAMAWLDTYYRSPEGLQRAQGLWIDNHPDYDAIGVWIFDVYLRHRLAGETEEQSRQAIAEAIQQTDEWRAKHRR